MNAWSKIRSFHIAAAGTLAAVFAGAGPALADGAPCSVTAAPVPGAFIAGALPLIVVGATVIALRVRGKKG